MSDHAWVHENLDAYLAGGLPLDERERLEAHVAACDSCVSALAQAQKIDRTLAALFAPARPDAALEDRVIQKLRAQKPRRLSRWSMAARVIGGAAAVLVLGALGAVIHAVAADGELPFPGMERQGRTASVNNLKAIGMNWFAFLDDSKSTNGGSDLGSFQLPTGGDTLVLPDDGMLKYNVDRLAEVSVPGLAKPEESVGIVDGEKNAQPLNIPAPGGFGKGQGGSLDDMKRVEVDSKRSFSKKWDESTRGPAVGNGIPPSSTFYGRSGATKEYDKLMDSKKTKESGYERREMNERQLTPPGDPRAYGRYEKMADTGKSEKAGKELGQYSFGLGFAYDTPTDGKPDMNGRYYKNHGYQVNGGDSKVNDNRFGTGRESPRLPALTGNSLSGAMPSSPPGLVPSSKSPVTNFSNNWAGNDVNVNGGGTGSILGPWRPSVGAYFKPADVAKGDPSKMLDDLKLEEKEKKRITEASKDQIAAEKILEKERTLSSNLHLLEKIRKPGEPAVAQPPKKQPEPPLEAARKIIRTGELEFEIESFDGSVASVATLVNSVKGGFIATVNSDKLPNGKVKGSVVVRMPPQFLDKFLLDLRKVLSKTGELKTQRIGSQDVTKQYTDIESRLRAAHTMEERLLAIIKNGKGEVKDLIAAERELGIWRTKIEEMEGEIRYYNNQVGLSTLTIHLTEKEIQAAAAVLLTERVGMKIEVEDVEKAHIEALKAVAAEKGRITKSELKQHPAGQLEAILQVEVAPDKAKKLRDLFKKLGNVTFNDVQRLQQAVGGGKVGEFEGKLKQADVQLHVVLYDTANIQPRESVTMLIATDDVQAGYRQLQAAVAKAKGQVRVGQLKEPDKININAEFNFDVPTPEKPGIDAVLAKLGVILASTNLQAPIQETATDRKFGYRLTLRNLATVPARDSSVLAIAVADVPKLYREIQDAVAGVKGVVHTRQLAEQDKVNIRADLTFDVPKTEKSAFDKVLDKLGMVLSTTSSQVPDNVIATDRKFGYRLTLLNLASIRPRETITVQIAAADVPTGFRALQETAINLKGLIQFGQLNEQDRLNITADVNFDVPREERAKVEDVLAKIGATLTSGVSQVPLNEIASDKKLGFRVKLLNLASVRPREIFTLELVTNDVRGNFERLRDFVTQTKGVLYLDRLTEDSPQQTNGRLDFDVSSDQKAKIKELLKDAGAVLKQSNSQANANELASDRKVGYRVVFYSIASIPPRDKATLAIKVQDVRVKADDLAKLVRDNKGQASKPRITVTPKGEMSASMVFDVPLSTEDLVLRLCRETGVVVDEAQTTNTQVPETALATAQIHVTLTGGRPTIPTDEGFWTQMQGNLYITFKVLSWSVMLIMLGLAVVVPWVLLIWLCVKVVRRMRGAPGQAPA